MKFNVLAQGRQAFPFGEGGFFISQGEMKKTEEVTAVRIRRNAMEDGELYRTSPAPFGGTLPKGEGCYFR